MVLAPQPEFLQIPIVPVEKLVSATAAVLTTNSDDESTLALVAQHLTGKLVLPEYWSHRFPQCGVLISSCICGGDLSRRFQEASEAYPRRCWLLLEPVCMEFSLPCPTGIGQPILHPGKIDGIYSPSLYCRYAHYVRDGQGFFMLWDTEETLAQKLLLARQWGFLGYASVMDTAPVEKQGNIPV